MVGEDTFLSKMLNTKKGQVHERLRYCVLRLCLSYYSVHTRYSSAFNVGHVEALKKCLLAFKRHKVHLSKDFTTVVRRDVQG